VISDCRSGRCEERIGENVVALACERSGGWHDRERFVRAYLGRVHPADVVGCELTDVCGAVRPLWRPAQNRAFPEPRAARGAVGADALTHAPHSPPTGPPHLSPHETAHHEPLCTGVALPVAVLAGVAETSLTRRLSDTTQADSRWSGGPRPPLRFSGGPQAGVVTLRAKMGLNHHIQ
jgi:hypothetical protein